jgi:hypothetical protein
MTDTITNVSPDYFLFFGAMNEKIANISVDSKNNSPSTSWEMFWPPTVLLHDRQCIYTCHIAKFWCSSSIHKLQLAFQ